jgi:hypothetical protein
MSEPGSVASGDPRSARGAGAPLSRARALLPSLSGLVRAKRFWFALALVAAVSAIGALLGNRYETLRVELTNAALARRAATAALAASVLSDKFERLVDVGVALATRVRFEELVRTGRWDDAIRILRRVPEDFDFVERVFLADRATSMRCRMARRTRRCSPWACASTWSCP